MNLLKKRRSFGSLLKPALAAVAITFGGMQLASAQTVILEIDLSNAAAATFTAKSSTNADNDQTIDTGVGFLLQSFLNTGHSDVTPTATGASTLRPDGTSSSSQFANQWFTQGPNSERIVLNNSTGSENWVFTDGVQGFAGTLTVDLSSVSAFFKNNGDTGIIQAGPTNVGLWEITAVPEPSTYAALAGGIGFLGVVGFRRFKSKAKAKK